MKKLLPLVVFILAIFSSINLKAQIMEDFESSDSTLPAGWSRINNAGFIISADPDVNWTVRDSGQYAPGLSSALTQSHNSLRSVGISWWASIDTVSGATTISDCYLVTPSFVPQSNWKINFWATGGSTNYSDSLQIWLSVIDSTASSFTEYINTIAWPTGSTYGNWTEYTYDIPSFVYGLTTWVGFRYYQDCAVDGFFVYIDDVFIGDPTSISQIGNNVPDKFALYQNYPNPFNPTTTIKFDLAKSTNVSLIVYNTLGQEVARLFDGNQGPGSYEANLDASKLSSGTYFYRLTTDYYTETKKMLLVK
ncbi:MAG: T9SS type A sorting domain-containing protein [Ignavibacteriae bacterium]|nr:T9SS type A sorting domain-containing protein [Ignavibacteriota bacterium]MCB9242634.1 T9SS type A sorting domain-containing protein [Ignavibacteriales bacterium]